MSACQNSSAKFTAPGSYPVRLDTVTAEVLARLLNFESLTSLVAVFDASTTRLAAVVFYLESDYGWNIERRDMAAGCNDGRVAWVTEYTINPLTIEAAMAAGAGKWRADVRRARAALRRKAAQAQRQAALANIAAAAARRRIHPGQSALFDLGGI
jgi:hypothetical protein